jgi:hypothetical protein
MTTDGATPPATEVLAVTGRSGPSRRLIAAVAAGVALIAVGVLGAGALQQRADDDLTTAVAEAAARTQAGEARVLSTLAYASPMIWSSSVPEDVRAGLRQLVQEAAADASGTLADVADQARSVPILPWQREALQRRDQVLALVLADQARFDAIARDARAIGIVLAEPAGSGAA